MCCSKEIPDAKSFRSRRSVTVASRDGVQLKMKDAREDTLCSRELENGEFLLVIGNGGSAGHILFVALSEAACAVGLEPR